ncbi:MAG: (2Fe-2S) ferredoxin domain-containing protein [Oscillospiraceae bacterium]|nr:(2Fe-2S) ferredoxin domain-containing protein [Oscillospiraceae bacterium]
MKSLEELKAIRERTRGQMNLRKEDGPDNTRIVVGMATCGIAAGAKPVLSAAVDQVGRRKLDHVVVTQTGCIGMCMYEPIVEIYVPGQEKVTYVKMTPERMEKIVAEHIVNGQIVGEYTIGANE